MIKGVFLDLGWTIFRPAKSDWFVTQMMLKYTSLDAINSLPQDKRNFAFNKALKYLDDHHLLFTEDEEIGGVGAWKAIHTLEKPNVLFIIEMDRYGKDNAAFYGCTNQKFKEYILSYGYKQSYGGFTDICVIGTKWDIAGVNLSAGYGTAGYGTAHYVSGDIVVNYTEINVERVSLILDQARMHLKGYNWKKGVYYLAPSTYESYPHDIDDGYYIYTEDRYLYITQ